MTPIPSKNERIAIAARWIVDEGLDRLGIVDRLEDMYGTARSTAYKDAGTAIARAGAQALNDQQFSGGIALHGAIRCTADAERYIAEYLEFEGVPSKNAQTRIRMGKVVHAAKIANAQAWMNLAKIALNANPGAGLNTEQGVALLLEALRQNAADLPLDDIQEATAILREAGYAKIKH